MNLHVKIRKGLSAKTPDLPKLIFSSGGFFALVNIPHIFTVGSVDY